MKLHYDPDTDLLRIELIPDQGQPRAEEYGEGVVLFYDRQGRLCKIEIQDENTRGITPNVVQLEIEEAYNNNAMPDEPANIMR